MKRKLVRGKPYLFRWNDTYSQGGWLSEAEVDEGTLDCFQDTVAFFVKEAKGWYVVAMHRGNSSGEHDIGNVCWIPKNTVVKVSPL